MNGIAICHAKYTYGAIQPECQKHQEEYDGPERRPRERGYGLGVRDENQTRPYDRERNKLTIKYRMGKYLTI